MTLDNNNTPTHNSTFNVENAFRKLKKHVYFDKTALPLRDKVVEFESDKNFQNHLIEIKQAYENADFSTIGKKIYPTIKALSFPKQMQDPQQQGIISVGNPAESPDIKTLQYFIDMDVRGHILGILWIMVFGERLDDMCMKNSYGNRLRKELIWRETGDIMEHSPELFEPYFAQYSSWRDTGLSCAEKILEKKHDALILTLDLKRFYYNTGVTEKTFNEILKDKEDRKNRELHKLVFSIISQYTKVLGEEAHGNVLPIGFLPSAVLSNWCLSKFDKGILDFWAPDYYGRYVDDIIIVEKVEKESKIFNMMRHNELTKEFIVEYYLGGKRHDTTRGFVKSSETAENISYKVESRFCLSDKSNFEFETNKMRVITLFSENNSPAVISKFKQEIYENTSEFRHMPEVEDAFKNEDFSQFYRLENDATVNKLRGLRGIAMDKYELSKFLGQYRVVNGLVDDGNTKRFSHIISKMFNNRELIEHYILWERIFEIFITDENYDGLTEFAKRIIEVIDMLPMKKTTAPGRIISPKNSLTKHLSASLTRVLSLIWGKKAEKICNDLSEDDEGKICISLREAYIKTCMSNKYIMPISAEIIPFPKKNYAKDLNLTKFVESFEYCVESLQEESSYNTTLLPYFRKAQDIAIERFIKMVCTSSSDNSPSYKEYIKEIRCLPDVPMELESEKRSTLGTVFDLIKISSKIVRPLKIAIANVKVDKVYRLESILKGRKANRTYSRYHALAKLINNAIDAKTDMLVFPENYVPFEWLSALATKAARDNLAIITGIEHLVVRKKVYNYTAIILPLTFCKEKIRTSAIFFQLKKYYSPKEKSLIEGYKHEVVEGQEKRPLYCWHDCYFPVYCCYELANIKDRAEFMSWADMVVAVESNKDTAYFGSIMESLTRDLHCYCIQVNTSEYGDSRITQPKKTEERDLLTVKGGENETLLIGEIDIPTLREFQIKDYALQKDDKDKYKPTPPSINVEIVRTKMKASLGDKVFKENA